MFVESLLQMMVKRLTVLVSWQHVHLLKVLQKDAAEKEVYSFGHQAMAEKIMTTVIVMGIQIQYGHYQYRVRQKRVLCHGIRRNVVPHWLQHTVAVVKKNIKL